ncbi:hypothetical protein SDRG_13939 [Saprolegnia diclina VS20]|uniref:Uncharacterized protein n=1 Tax=Saprolegnia diclina (strain VS20) TaxID=1156394 RepID=T0R851_SAPDV|nr:hypothetical protein SDRG_13939 [Saprolegnia diclina VS20]EQC28258.1 hypothetical protein SDRG_13939 [Saprolegnia diclina VS20]|eukprot:XP_008618262.1 hypothetical protein SDRG_13939 [Saprolegnia diclina VS20]
MAPRSSRISPLSDAPAAALANGMQQFPDTIASTLMAKCDAFGAPVMHRHNDMEADRGMLAHLGSSTAPRQRSSRATT